MPRRRMLHGKLRLAPGPALSWCHYGRCMFGPERLAACVSECWSSGNTRKQATEPPKPDPRIALKVRIEAENAAAGGFRW